MYSTNECLNKAMLIASESYSGSSYEFSFSDLMDMPCDEELLFVTGEVSMDVTAMAA